MRRLLFLVGLLAFGPLVPVAQAAAPVITLNPASQSTTVGQPVTFMSLANGTAPLQYQWWRDTAMIPNATNRNYTLLSAQLSDDGAQFFVIVTNTSGSATSSVATLTVTPDTTSPTVVKVGNTPNFMQVKVKFSERVNGSTANDPANYQLDQGIGVTGAVLGIDGTNVTLTVSPALTEGNGYNLTVGNIFDLANNPLSPDPTTVFFQAAIAPQITTQPHDVAVNPGQPAAFTVVATGTAPLSYRWYRDLTPLAATTDTLQFPAVSQANLGDYYVVIMNSAGSVTSAVVKLSFLESYQLDLPAGFALIANHYSNPQPTFPSVPLGTQLSIWRVPLGGFETFLFDDFGGGAGEWAPSTPTLNPGEGAIIHLQSPAVLLFAGQRVTPMVPSSYPSGLHLVSAQVPIIAGFKDLLSSQPKEGQFIYQLRPGGNPALFDETNYRLTYFRYGMWHDNPPQLQVGEAAWVGYADPVGFTTQPVAQTNINLGQSVSFSVNVTGAPPIHFQWLLNGSPIPGATNSSYSIATLNPTNCGLYSVVAGNLVGDVVSQVAALTPNVPTITLTDDFDSQTSVNNAALLRTSQNRGATRAAVEPAHAGKRANASVWITWVAPANGIIQINTAGSGFDTILAAYTGSSVGNLTPVQASDDDAGYACSRISFNAVASTPYRICVAGLGDETGDIVLNWVFQSISQLLPDILQQPQDLSVGDGGSAQFTVVATNGNNLTYQWFRDGLALTNGNGTNATLTISNASFNDVGYYFVRVSNGQRFRDSELVSLQVEKVNAGQPPTGARGAPKFFDLNLSDSGGNPLKGGPSKLIVGTVNHGYSGAGYLPCSLGRDPGEPFPCSIYGANTSWYAVQADTNGTMYINSDGSNFDTLLAAYIGPGNSFSTLTNVACDNNSGLDGFDSRISFPATTGTIYFLQIQGVGAASGIAAISYKLVRPLSITNLVYTNGFGGRFTMKVNSTSNLLTRVQYLTNFASTNWITLTNYTPPSGTFNVTNSSVGASTNRFYRALNIF